MEKEYNADYGLHCAYEDFMTMLASAHGMILNIGNASVPFLAYETNDGDYDIVAFLTSEPEMAQIPEGWIERMGLGGGRKDTRKYNGLELSLKRDLEEGDMSKVENIGYLFSQITGQEVNIIPYDVVLRRTMEDQTTKTLQEMTQ